MTPVKTNWIDRLNFWQVDPHMQTPSYIHDECKHKFSKSKSNSLLQFNDKQQVAFYQI